jgi:hypothetical protein
LSVAELVRLAVALVVALLAGADDDVYRRRRDPRLAGVLVLPREPPELYARVRVGHDEQAVSLAEAAAGRSVHHLHDALHDVVVDRLVAVRPHHPPPAQEVTEFHGPTLGERRRLRSRA